VDQVAQLGPTAYVDCRLDKIVGNHQTLACLAFASCLTTLGWLFIDHCPCMLLCCF
jgi:hypothetical protein